MFYIIGWLVKKNIEKYIIDAIVQYNSLNKFKNDEINLLDLKV